MQPTSTIIPCVFSLLLRMNAPTVYNVEHTHLTHKKTSILNALPNDIIHKIFACTDLSSQKALRCTCLTLSSLDIKDILRHSPLILSKKDLLKWMIYTAHNNDSITFANLLYTSLMYKNGYRYAKIYETVSYFLPNNPDKLQFSLCMYYKNHDPVILEQILPCIMAIYRAEEKYINNYAVKNTWWPHSASIPSLYIATRNNHISIMKILLSSHSVNVNEQVFSGYTALHLAAYNNLLSAAQCLLEHGANVNITDNRNCTPLLLASYEGATEIVALLLAYKADTTIGGKRDKPLHGAIINRRTPVVRILIEYGVDVNEKYNNNTPLIMAVENNNYDICELLLKNGAQVDGIDEHRYTALLIAASDGQYEIVQLLITHGANINHQSKYHETALLLALQGKHKRTIKFLLKQPDIEINEKEEKLLLRLKKHRNKKELKSIDFSS